MATVTDVESAVRETLDRFAQAYAAKDIEAVMRLCAPGDDIRLVGTGADEIRLGRAAVREQVERDFAQSDALSLSYKETHVSSAGDVAWVLALCTAQATIGEQTITLHPRLTAVFVRQGDEWLLRQTHLSVAMAGQEAGESFPTS